MANSYSTSDLVKGALFNAGEATDGTSPLHALALKYVDSVYKSVLSGSNEFDPDIGDCWVWARTSKTLLLEVPYSTGTVSVTNGSSAGAFSVAPAASQAGRYLLITGMPTYYVISTHTAGMTAFTLDQTYVETTNGTAAFNSIPLSYNLGTGILRLVEPLRIYVNRQLEELEREEDEGRIYGMDLDTFREKFPLRCLRSGIPSKFTTYSRSETTWNVFVNKYTTTQTKVDYDVILAQPDLVDSDDNVPLIPREFRKILEFGAAHYLHISKSNDTKAAYFFNQTKALLKAMQLAENKNDVTTDKAYGRLTPRLDDQRYKNWLIY